MRHTILSLGFLLGLAVACGAGVPRTSVAADWRSAATGWGGWGVDGDALVFANQRLPASLISAEPVCEKWGGITFRFRQVFGSGARLELRFRAAGDERDYAALVVEPGAGQVSLVRLASGQPIAALGAAVAVGPLGATPHRLAYRIEGRRVTAVLDGKDVLSAAGAAPAAPGRIGLAAAWAEVEVRDLALELAPLAADDSFETLAGWTTLYGPESAWHAASGPEAAGSEHVAVFSAAADGAIVTPREWTHFAAEVKGRFLEASNTWACFGLRPKLSADGGSLYVIEVRGKQNALAFYKVVAGQRDAAFARDVPLTPIQANRWYTLRCEFVGDHIAVDVDGKRCLEVVDPNPLEKGRTAISASYATVQLDEFRQQELASDYVFAPQIPDTKAFRAGKALPPAAATGLQDENYWYLDGKDLRVAIHKQTGALGGLLRRRDGLCLADRVQHLYKLETRTTAALADADGDTVEAVLRSRPDGVVMRCVNPALPGVSIEKDYAFAGAGDRLVETVRCRNTTDQPDLFLTLAERVVIDSAYRRAALYTGGSYLGPLVPATSIRGRVLTDSFKLPWVTGITNGRPSWVLALNRDLGTHLATYRYRVNGQYVLPWNSIWTEDLHNLYHTPVGWEMGVATLHLLPQQEASTEVHYRLFEGSRLDFYNAYMDLPEVRRMYARVGPRPAWLRDLKMPVESTSDYALSLTEDGVLLKLDSPFLVWGDLPVSGSVRTGAGSARLPVERLRDKVQRGQARSPRLRIGFYTWAWSASHRSGIVTAHPDWFIGRDKAGQIRNAYPMAMSYLRCLSAPGCLDGTLRMYHDLVRFYGEDFQYLDNDGTGAQIIDWEHLRLDQDYDWQRLHEGVLAAARQHPLLSLSRRPGGPESGATFFNNRVLPQGDISFAEFMEAEIQNRDWRRPANEMIPLKLFQKRDTDRLIPLLYWRDPNRPSYANYCVGLGLLPWGDRLSQVPFINAAFETRGLEVVDANLTPDWQRDLSTSVEAYTLRLGRAAVVSFIGHGETPQETEIAFDTAPFGLQPGRPFSAWLFELADDRDHAGRLTEREQRQAYREAHWADETVVAAQCVEAIDHLPPRYASRYFMARPQRLRMLVLTQVPALTWSVNGQRCNFWLPGNRYLDLDGDWDPAAGTAEVVCRNEAASAEIVLPIPEGRRVLEVKLDGKPVTWDLEAAGHASLVRLALPHGRHRVHLRTAVREAWPMCRVLAAEAPARVRAGGSLPLHVRFEPQHWTPADGAVLSILHDGVLVASAKPTRLEANEAEFAVPVPASARPGVYQLRLSHPDPLSMGGVAGFTVEPGNWQPSAPPGGEVGSPVVKVWDVGRTLRDIRVLRAATDTFDHRGGTQLATLDVDRLSVRCGLLDDSPSPWGYGFCGVEVAGINSITVDLRNTFAAAVQDGLELGDRYLDSFAGFIIDYHTPQGYTKRVALSLGVYCPTRPVPAPNWGKVGRPDACLAWSRSVLEKPTDSVTVDLGQYAPPDWDGQAWFSVGVDTVSRGLQIEATITHALPR